MQIVIDIDEDKLKLVKKHGLEDNFILCDIVVKAIKRGTPLPKGHGRIADMDEAIKCLQDVEGEDAIWAINLIEWACAKRTIIEADRSVEDGKTN